MTAINLEKILSYFDPFRKISIAPLIVFRIIFGSLMLFGAIRFIAMDWVEKLYITPKYYFGFLGFEWVKPLNGYWMYLPFIIMILGALLILLGLFYRIGAVLFFVSFTYVELLDKTNYLNHYYFVSLMAFLMILVPANAKFSLDAILFPKLRRNETYNWHIGIIKFQLAVVYIFAGIAKLNYDWLFLAQPLKTWLQAHHHLPIVGGVMDEEWLAYAFSWMGCIYDLFIVFFLLNNKLRKYAYFFVIFFHIVTWYLFPIGVFPWVMIFSTLIFFSPEFHNRLLSFFTRKNYPVKKDSEIVIRTLTRSFLIIYVLIQLIMPFRYLLYKGNLFWHEQGFRFSWRVMLMHKEGYGTFYLVDSKTKRELIVDANDFLTPIQVDQMITQPDMILQFAKIIRNHYNGKTLTFDNSSFTIHNPEVRADIYVSLNARASQLFVSRKYDLAKIKNNLGSRYWLEPFQP